MSLLLNILCTIFTVTTLRSTHTGVSNFQKTVRFLWPTLYISQVGSVLVYLTSASKDLISLFSCSASSRI